MKALIRSARMRAVIEKMLVIVDNVKLSTKVRREAERVMRRASKIAYRAEKELQ